MTFVRILHELKCGSDTKLFFENIVSEFPKLMTIDGKEVTRR